MSIMDERQKGFENKFAHDEEVKFKIASRRRKLLGLWVGEVLKLDDNEALKYALNIVEFGLDNTNAGAVINKILQDVSSAGLSISESEIRIKNDEFEEVARRQIISK